MEGERNEYHRFLGVDKEGYGGLQALFHNVCSHLVIHTAIFDSIRSFLGQDMDCDLCVYLPAIFEVVSDCTASFRSATSICVETRNATLS